MLKLFLRPLRTKHRCLLLRELQPLSSRNPRINYTPFVAFSTTVILPTGETLEGEFDGHHLKRGSVTLKDGTIRFEGSFREYTGKGMSLQNLVLSGFGKIKIPKEWEIEGTFEDGIMRHGTIKNASGSRYDGDVIMDALHFPSPHGNGKLKLLTNEFGTMECEGRFEDGFMVHGKTLMYIEGGSCSYEGDIRQHGEVNGEIMEHGKGKQEVYQRNYHQTLEGTFESGVFKKGTIRRVLNKTDPTNFTQIEGDNFTNLHLQGEGKLNVCDILFFEGLFVDGLMTEGKIFHGATRLCGYEGELSHTSHDVAPSAHGKGIMFFNLDGSEDSDVPVSAQGRFIDGTVVKGKIYELKYSDGTIEKRVCPKTELMRVVDDSWILADTK